MVNQEMYPFLDYYHKAKWLQDNCNLGDLSYTGIEATMIVNDELMMNNKIYDCVNRRYAGFSNVPQDLVLGIKSPKLRKMDPLKQEIVAGYVPWEKRSMNNNWWMLLVHRITGSGASFGSDHGYRNSIVHHFGLHYRVSTMKQLMEQWRDNKLSMFTSIGNQPPAPKKGTSNVDFMLNEAQDLLWSLEDAMRASGEKWTHKMVVDYLNQYNLRVGHRRFNFAYSAFAMDLSDYYPGWVDETSHTYLGNNAKRAVKEVFGHQRFDEAMEELAQATGGLYKDLEDVLCDYVRYLKGYTEND